MFKISFETVKFYFFHRYFRECKQMINKKNQNKEKYIY